MYSHVTEYVFEYRVFSPIKCDKCVIETERRGGKEEILSRCLIEDSYLSPHTHQLRSNVSQSNIKTVPVFSQKKGKVLVESQMRAFKLNTQYLSAENGQHLVLDITACIAHVKTDDWLS